MDLTNKQIRISRMMAQAMPAKTTVNVDVVEAVDADTRRTVVSYEMSFPEMYSNPDDPLLLGAITDKLTSLPSIS